MCLNLNDYEFKASRHNYGLPWFHKQIQNKQEAWNSSILQKKIIKPEKERDKKREK